MNRLRRMMSSKAWNQTVAVELALTAVIIGAVMLIAYQVNGIYPFGEASIARGDMVQQTIPAGMYYVWDVLHGNASPFFTWNSAFGMNISGATCLGAFLSPLNLLLYFSPRSSLFYYVNLLLILKMICVAYAMYFYLRKYKVSSAAHMTGGILYAFGAAALVHFQIIMVLEAAFLLPLLMIGADRVFEKKGCKFLIAILTLSMVVNVYTGCMLVVFLFLSSGLRLFLDTKGHAERGRCALWLGISVFAALLLSAVVTVPALLCISNTPRTGGGTPIETYKMAIEQVWSEYEWMSVKRMLVNVALPISCILYFLFRGRGTLQGRLKSYRGQICLLVLMVLSVLVHGIELLWHGGSRASWPVRFVFIITFVVVDFAMLIYQDNKRGEEAQYNKKKLLPALCISGVAAVVSGLVFYRIYEAYCENENYAVWGDGTLCLVVEIVFCAVFLILWNLKNKMVLLAFLCAELTCTSVLSFAPNKDNAQVWNPEYLEMANNAAVSMESHPGDFERIKNTDYVIDHIEYSLVFGDEAISNYWHVIPDNLQPDFAALGYTINWTQLLDTGGTVFTDTLFHIKYYLSRDEMPEDLYEYCQDVDITDEESLGLYKNRLELPFAIGTDVSGLTAEGEKFAAQNSLFTAVTGNSAPLIEDISGQMEQPGYYNLNIGNEKKLLYFYGTNTGSSPVSIYVNGNPVIIPSSSAPDYQQYPSDFGNGLICLGSFQNQQVAVQFTGSAAVSDIHLGMLDYNTLTDGIARVTEQNPEILSVRQRNAGVDIELDRVTKPNIFLPVKYEEGWVCEVNGEKVSALGNVDGMLSIPVKNGKNSIRLRYVAPGRRVGAALSGGALAALVAVILISRKKKLDETKAVRIAGYAAYAVFAAVFAAFLVLMFVVPFFTYFGGTSGGQGTG